MLGFSSKVESLAQNFRFFFCSLLDCLFLLLLDRCSRSRPVPRGTARSSSGMRPRTHLRPWGSECVVTEGEKGERRNERERNEGRKKMANRPSRPSLDPLDLDHSLIFSLSRPPCASLSKNSKTGPNSAAPPGRERRCSKREREHGDSRE